MTILGWFFENKIDVKLKSMFSQMAALTVSCADELRRFFDDIENSETIMQRIAEQEHQGDDLTQKVHQLLDRTFIISWLDKEDATHLADHLDSFLDASRGMARHVRIYDLTEVRPRAKEITESICEIADGVQALMTAFIKKDFASVTKHHDAISQLERKVDDLRDLAIRQLWQETDNDCRQFIAWRDVFEGLEKVADRGHHIAQIILSLARKSQ